MSNVVVSVVSDSLLLSFMALLKPVSEPVSKTKKI